MEIKLQRFADNGETTLGCLSVDGDPFCLALEDESRIEKVPHETRIPAGRYEIKVRNEGGMNERYGDKLGSRHRGMIWLQDVPSFTWVYIHIGNTDEHTSGCILTGFGIDMNPMKKWRTTNSTGAYNMLAALVYDEILDNGNKVFITIIDEVK